MGEFLGASTDQSALGFLSGIISILSLAIYTLLSADTGNDDDDSDSGSGGLMQPI